MLARRNRFTLDWTRAWRLDAPPAWRGQAQVQVAFADPVPARPDRLIAEGLGISRNEVLRLVKCGIPLRRRTSAGLTFTVIARD